MGSIVQSHTAVLLAGAYQMARRSSEVPVEKVLALESKIWVYGAVLFSASYLESWINELFEFERVLGFQLEERHGKDARLRIRQAREDGITGRQSRGVLSRHGASGVPATLGKYDVAHRLLSGKPLDREASAWGDAARMLQLRHELVHPVPDSVRLQLKPEPAVVDPGRIASLLAGYVPPNPRHLDPREHPSNRYYSGETARWAVRAAYRFVQEFHLAVGPFGMPDEWDHIIDRKWVMADA